MFCFEDLKNYAGCVLGDYCRMCILSSYTAILVNSSLMPQRNHKYTEDMDLRNHLCHFES